MDSLVEEHLVAFFTSLAIGLLIGVERERSGSAIGLRTTALAALFGAMSALVGQSALAPWFLPAALLAVTAITVLGSTGTDERDPHTGATTRISILLSFTLGAMVWLGHGPYAVMLAIMASALLHFKAELHGISARITSRDLVSVLQFAALSFIVLPLLPKVGYGPYGALNPHHVWLMVVLVSGLNLAGYLAMRIAGDRFGPPLLGLLGGLVSSTATTLVYARHARQTPAMMPTSAFIILMANLVVSVRLGAIAYAVAPTLMATLWPVLAGNLFAGGLAALISWRRGRENAPLPPPDVTNPTELRVALTFGAIYAGILLLVSWLSDWAGARGLYVAAAVSGLTDLDAISLSAMRLFGTNKLSGEAAAYAIGLAIFSNLCFKTGLLTWVAGYSFFRRCLPGLATIGTGILIGIAWIAKT
jgi:uncharacterized membrane protein (DUF4010 family)